MEKALKLSLLISLVGIYILFTLSLLLMPQEYSIEKALDEETGKAVKVSGKITSMRLAGSMQVLSISDNTNSIGILASGLEKAIINKTAVVIGKISEYNLKNQIVANKISIKG